MTIKEFEIQLALGTLTYDMKCDLAENPNTPKEVLTILSTDKNRYVRHRVADNLNTPKEVLKKLSKDIKWGVRHWAVKNLN